MDVKQTNKLGEQLFFQTEQVKVLKFWLLQKVTMQTLQQKQEQTLLVQKI